MAQRAEAAPASVTTPMQSLDARETRQPRLTRADLLRRDIWHDALLAWGVQHLILLGLTVAGRFMAGQPTAIPAMLAPWMHAWDSGMYSLIASTGYSQPWLAAFFPLLAIVERGLTVVPGVHPALAGLLIANLAGLGYFGLFRLWAERETSAALARRALWTLALFPTSLFLAAAYSEALFLVLTVATFLALRSRYWLWTGILGALATLTRPFGILLALPIALSVLLELRAHSLRMPGGQISRLAAAVALPVLALAGFMAYLAHTEGSLFATLHAENSAWNRHLSAPWVGPLRSLYVLTHPYALSWRLVAFDDLLFLLLFVLLVIGVCRSLPAVYGLYSAAVLTLVLLTPQLRDMVLAMGTNKRYQLAAFPIFLMLAVGCRSKGTRLTVFAISLLLLCIFTIFFATGTWVA